MKYMLLVCGDDTADASGMAPVEPWVGEHGARSGVRLHGHRLRLPAEAVTVRVRDGEVLRTDGPFADCDSLEEAVEVAAQHPAATVGAMEVRAFWTTRTPRPRSAGSTRNSPPPAVIGTSTGRWPATPPTSRCSTP
jgi:hypothetical protein